MKPDISITRRSFLAAAAAPAASRKGAVKRPNIVLIIADDLAAWMLGCYGNQEIKTPHIDTLARTGVRFTNSLVCTPICSASRATLFTGRTPMQHGIHCFLTAKPIEQPPQGQAAPPPSFAQEVMISELLAGAGYRCGYIGKWHMGNDEKPGRGYELTYTMLGGRTHQNPVMSLNGQKVQEEGYLAELMTRRACDFIHAQKPSEPFFLTVSYLNPHVPYDGHPQKYYDMYANSRFETFGYERPAPNALREKELMADLVGNIRKCAASVTALDDQVAELVRTIDRKGLRDDTIIVFTGDNGFLLGRHGLFSKGLASDPINMYEEVMQVPMIWSWRGKIPAEATRSELISFYDFLPTVCEAAGVTPPDRNLCGRSYLPLATNRPLPKNRPWPTVAFGYFRNTQMARDGRYKLVIRNQGDGPNELFDLRSDPREKVNQYENPEFLTVRDRLRRDLDAWLKKYSS